MITSFAVDVRPAENQERMLARLIKLVQPIVPLAAADGYADVNQEAISHSLKIWCWKRSGKHSRTLQCVNCIQ